MEIDYSKYTVLVVDDIPTNILLLKVILEQEKFNVISAQSGRDALKLVASENVDLVLLDVMMPEMNGIEVAEKIKQSEQSETPIIFITALNSSDEIVKGFMAGGSDYITKPFNKDELISRVKHQISLIDAKRTILQQTEELKALIEARDRLYTVIAHDLRSPVSSLKMVINALCIMAKNKNVDPDFVEMLDAGNEISEEVFSLLDNLLKWAKAQSGIQEPILQPFDMHEIIMGLADVLIPAAKFKSITIDLQVKDSALVLIDIDMMKSVVRNLVFNAIKFSYPGSIITVFLKKEKDHAIVEVHDQGCGISAENQKKLQSKLSSFSTYGTNKEEGTGIGLLLSKHFVEIHHGEFFFESVDGHGSTFGFRIPLNESAI